MVQKLTVRIYLHCIIYLYAVEIGNNHFSICISTTTGTLTTRYTVAYNHAEMQQHNVFLICETCPKLGKIFQSSLIMQKLIGITSQVNTVSIEFMA